MDPHSNIRQNIRDESTADLIADYQQLQSSEQWLQSALLIVAIFLHMVIYRTVPATKVDQNPHQELMHLHDIYKCKNPGEKATTKGEANRQKIDNLDS